MPIKRLKLDFATDNEDIRDTNFCGVSIRAQQLQQQASIVPFHWTPDFWISRIQSFRRQGSTQPRRATAPQAHVLCVKASIVISTSGSAFATVGENQPKPG
jgi:hypothetical protein|uniref:WGS project CBMI000000000 data, contig CS3069_c000848 n=1 Tax=Fusarium clavum TaxID=2594811 RepID=A0A090N5C9_9HYPO|nr:unnamed protein product [Fusarium clavum]